MGLATIALIMAAAPALAAPATSIASTAVCAVVHGPTGTTEAIRGERWRVVGASAEAPVIVLVHGGASTHVVWDQPASLSIARGLARTGLTVIAIDWLGPDSPAAHAPNAGALERGTDVQPLVHEFVRTVRSGTYRLGSCTGEAAGGHPRAVVLAGHSAGNVAAVSGYAGQYHDVDAVVQAGWSHFGFSAPFAEMVVRETAAATARGEDDIQLFAQRRDCKRLLLYAGPGADPGLPDEVCAPRNFVPVPFGYGAGLPPAALRSLAQITQTGPKTPVLITWADHEGPFTPEMQQLEERWWRTTCGCSVTSWTQRNAGHAFMWHQSATMWVDQVVHWLAEHGIEGQQA